MNRSDLETLKKMLDGTDFEVLNESEKDNDKFYVVKKKDIWDGVEFIDRDGSNWPICKVDRITDDRVRYFNQDGAVVFMYKKDIKPSDENTYKLQLERIAFEKFGEIKEGEKFNCFDSVDRWFTKMGNTEWDYIKEKDMLFHYNICLYQQGKWATKLPERVKVRLLDHDIKNKFNRFDFEISTEIKRDIKLKEFLEQQLEEYINQQK